MSKGAFGLFGAVLAVGAFLLVLHREQGIIPAPYMALLLGGTAGVSLAVGYALGYVADSGLWPSRKRME